MQHPFPLYAVLVVHLAWDHLPLPCPTGSSFTSHHMHELPRHSCPYCLKAPSSSLLPTTGSSSGFLWINKALQHPPSLLSIVLLGTNPSGPHDLPVLSAAAPLQSPDGSSFRCLGQTRAFIQWCPLKLQVPKYAEYESHLPLPAAASGPWE